MTVPTLSPVAATSPTPLALHLDQQGAPPALESFAGIQTPVVFTDTHAELTALTTTAGVYDHGHSTRLRITGADRSRWLNGMVTNSVKALEPGHLLYTFLLNAQGRIQGDADLYALPDALLLATDAAQAAHLQAHLDRFIIMDDVELAPEPDVTALGLTGPHAAAMLTKANLLSHETAPLQPGQFLQAASLLVACLRPQSYLLWIPSLQVATLWQQLVAAGATPCGLHAVEALRVLTGTPRYGTDIHEKTLAQETGQMQALNFNKGCYLGQEIVERIRSRATLNRSLRVFALSGAVPAPGTPLYAPSNPDTAVGELTSIATATLPTATGTFALGTFALGIVRTEAVAAAVTGTPLAPLTYPGGAATVLARPPLPAS